MAVFVDFVVFGLTLVLSLAIGIGCVIFKGKNNTLYKYLFGGGQLGGTALGISFAVTLVSSFQIIGMPAEIYAYGFQFILVILPLICCVFYTGIYVVPVIKATNVTGLFEYFEKRFKSNKIRLFLVLLSVMEMVMVIAIGTLGLVLVAKTVIDLPAWVGICIIISTAVIYTTLGGLTAVVFIDLFQAAIIWIGILILVIKCTVDVGGVGYVMTVARGRLTAFSWSFDPTERHTVWNIIVCFPFGMMSMYLAGGSIQRIISAKDISSARHMLFVNLLYNVCSYIMLGFAGIVFFAFTTKSKCDPFAANMLKNVNQITPYVVMRVFRNAPGLTGLFIAALSAASLSTVSSLLSAIAATVTEDVIKPLCVSMNTNRRLRMSKLVTIIAGVAGGLISYLFSFIAGPLTQVGFIVISIVGGPKVAIFFTSIHFRKTTTLGIYIGYIAGVVMAGWFSFGRMLVPNLPVSPMLPYGPVINCYPHFTKSNVTTFEVSNDDVTFVVDSNLLASSDVINQTELLNISRKMPSYETSTSTKFWNTPEVTGVRKLYTLSYLFTAPIGFFVTFVITFLVSLFQSRSVGDMDVDPKLMVALTDCLRCSKNVLENTEYEQANREDIDEFVTESKV